MAIHTCQCGGSFLQHQNDPEGCWCRNCLALDRDRKPRCQEFNPTPLVPGADEAPAIKNEGRAREAIIDTFKRFGALTDEQLYRHMQVACPTSITDLKMLRAQLQSKQVIKDSGQEGFTSKGNRTTVWVLDDGQGELL